MKKRGFTLVELLAVIVIFSIILLISVPVLINSISNKKRESTEKIYDIIKTAARNYVIDTNINLPATITINELCGRYIACPIIDPSTKEELEGYILAGNEYVYSSSSLVSFSVDLNGGLSSQTFNEKYDVGTIITLEEPTKENNDFAGWTIVSGSGKVNGNIVKVGVNGTKLYAMWSSWPKLTIDLDGGENNQELDDVYKSGTNITLTEPIKEGYKFAGWKVISGNGIISGNNFTMGSEDTSLKATWKELGTTYISSLLAQESTLNNGLQQTTATYTNTSSTEVTLNAGVRYIGASDEVNNYIYFNCEDKDANNIEYGKENYNYKNSCEVWRIIGVFDVEDENGNIQKRIKIINTESTFKASWDSSSDGSIEGETAINDGWGINQWGESTLTDGTVYLGADLMQLLNGFYISKTGSECEYNNAKGQAGFEHTCTTDDLKTVKMKPLTNNALSYIDNALWYTYAVTPKEAEVTYLHERGITIKYTGCSKKVATTTNECESDGVIRNNEWTGLVGLMSASDIAYANGWLYNPSDETLYPWLISPDTRSEVAYFVCTSNTSYLSRAHAISSNAVWPSVYLKYDVLLTGTGATSDYFKIMP